MGGDTAAYLLAVAGCAVATLIRMALEPILGETSHFIIYYLAVAPAAIIGGLRPGLLATFLAALFGVAFLAAPDHLIWPPDPAFATRLVLFVLSGVMISMIAQRAVTSRRTAQHRLAEIGAIYRNAAVGMCLLDAELRFRAVNQSFAEIAGHSVADHLGHSIHEILPASLAAQAEPRIRQALKMGQPELNHEITDLRLDDGRTVTLLASYNPVYSQDGHMLGISIIFQDLTTQRENQQRLRQSEGRLRAIFDNAGVGIVEVSGDDQFIAANEQACEFSATRLGSFST